MQIASFLRRGGATVVVLVGVPVLAMAGAGLVASGAEPSYRAVATVVVGPPSGASGGAALSQAVEGFQSALRTDVVLEEAAGAAEDDLTAGELLAVTSSRRLGGSSVVEVVYDGPRREDVDVVLGAQAKAAVRLVFGAELAAAELARDGAQERLEAATGSVRALEQSTGLLLPEEDYRAKAGEVTALRVSLAQTTSRGVETAAVASALAKAEQQLRDLATKAAQFEQPQYALDRARNDLTDAQARLTDVETRLAAAESPALLRVGSGQVQPGTVSAARTVVSAGVLGVLLALAVLFLFDALSGQRSRRQALAQGAQPLPLEHPHRTHITPRRRPAEDDVQEQDLVPSARREA